MDKKIIALPLILLCALALGPDDYVCLKYSDAQACLSATGLPAQVVYGDLHLSGAFTSTGATLQYTLHTTSLTDDYALVQLISGSSIGVKDLQVDGVASGVVRSGDYYAVPVKGKGNHVITLNAILSAPSYGITQTAEFNLPLNVSFTQVQMHVPAETSLDIQPHLTQEQSGTNVIAQIGSTPRVVMTLTKTPVTITEAQEPKLYADVNTLATMKESSVSVFTSIDYNILHTGVSLLEASLPSDASVVDVQGADNWKVTDADGRKRVQFIYRTPRTGSFSVHLTYEKSFTTTGYTTDIPELHVIGVEREHGFIGIMADTAIEATEVSYTGLSKIDPTELPSIIWANSIRPVVYAYKYLEHPWSLSLQASKHEELPVLIAAVDRADLLSLMAGDKMLTKYTLYVKNNRKQYLELQAPADAEVWSTFVDGQPVKPVKDGDTIKIPLIKSYGTTTLQSFPVEIVYISGSSSLPVWYRYLSTPTVDLPISQLSVQVYLPAKEIPWFVYTDLETGSLDYYYEPSPYPLAALGAASAPRDMYVKEEIAAQATEMVNVAKEKGVLPVEVTVPQQGNLIQLKKMLVVSDAPSPVFIIQLHDILSTLLGVALLSWLTYAFQKAVVDSIEAKTVKKSTIAWAVGIFILLNWVLWETGWMPWAIAMFGTGIAVCRILWDKFVKPAATPKPKKR